MTVLSLRLKCLIVFGKMKNMEVLKTISIIVFAILWAATLGVAYFVASNTFTRYDAYNTTRIIHECAQDYHYEITNEDSGRVTIRPLEQQVRECVYQKGIKKSTWDGVWSKDADESAATEASLATPKTVSRR